MADVSAGRTPRVGVLISGRGSNLQALIDAARDPSYPAELTLVIANAPEAKGLERAEAAGIATQVVDNALFASRPGFEAAITQALVEADCDLVCLAGFMRVLTADFVERWENRLLNIHPSLLPAFPGLHTHAEAIAAGVRFTGATVHFVRAAVDAGPIVGQAVVPVQPDDDAERLAARVLQAEHRLYPHCLRLVAEGRTRVVGQRVEIDGGDGAPGQTLFSPEI